MSLPCGERACSARATLPPDCRARPETCVGNSAKRGTTLCRARGHYCFLNLLVTRGRTACPIKRYLREKSCKHQHTSMSSKQRARTRDIPSCDSFISANTLSPTSNHGSVEASRSIATFAETQRTRRATYRTPRHRHSAHMVGNYVYGGVHTESVNVVTWHEYRKRRIAGRRPRQSPRKRLKKVGL